MTPEEYQANFNALIADLQGGALGDVLIATANVAMTLVKQRVQETGINAEGKSLGEYSKGYKAYKQRQGKYKGFVDLSFTNRMWTNTQIVSNTSEANADIGKATISQLGQENKDKMARNTERYGAIMEVSEKEIEHLQNVYNGGIINIFKKHGLAFK